MERERERGKWRGLGEMVKRDSVRRGIESKNKCGGFHLERTQELERP